MVFCFFMIALRFYAFLYKIMLGVVLVQDLSVKILVGDLKIILASDLRLSGIAGRIFFCAFSLFCCGIG